MNIVKENLIKAKALIDTPDKWSKGGLIDNNGCLCSLGAIAVATGISTKDDLTSRLDYSMASSQFANTDASGTHPIYNALIASPEVQALAGVILSNHPGIVREYMGSINDDLTPDYPVMAYNDTNTITHQDMMAAFDNAINKA
jgi:hypothetical protein